MTTRIADENHRDAVSEARGMGASYLIASIAATLALLGMTFDIVLSMMPGWGTDTVPTTAVGWLQQMAENPLLGLRNLDLLNVIISLVALPMYVAIAMAHKRARPGAAAVGLAFVAIGTTLFAASNAALPMLELAGEWAAGAGADSAAITAAAEGLLAQGTHGSTGAFLGFFLSEIGTLAIAIAMLSGVLVSKRVAWMGVIGATMLAIYTVVMTFGSVPASLVVGFAAPGGILMIAWQAVVARRLWKESRSLAEDERGLTPESVVRPLVPRLTADADWPEASLD